MIIKTRASLAERVRGRGEGDALLHDAGDPGAADRERRRGLSRLADGGDRRRGRDSERPPAIRPRGPADSARIDRLSRRRVPSITPLSSTYSSAVVLPQIAATFSQEVLAP